MNPIPLAFEPGIQRDNTRLNAARIIDAHWCRFDAEGKPRKMRGWQTLTTIPDIPRGISQYSSGTFTYHHVGTREGLYRFTIGPTEAGVSFAIDRSPASGLVDDPLNVWAFDSIYDSITGDVTLFAQALPTGASINTSTPASIFYGDATATAALVELTTGGGSPTAIQSDGGFFALHPYLFLIGSGGEVQWSVAGSPTDFAGTGSGNARITASKLVAGRKARGAAGSQPSGLIWSLDTLIRVSFTGGATVFGFDEIGTTSVLSPACIVEYDGVFFWPGSQRFYTYAGTLRELPNTMNADFFFDNINYAARGRAFGFVSPRFGEIWWCYPRGTATECTHAIVYNVRLNVWYDTPLPNLGRTCATTPSLDRFPIMGDLRPTGTGGTEYRVLRHEFGFDEDDVSRINAVKSSFTTPDITLLKGREPQSRVVDGLLFEPDFVQMGDLTMTVAGNANARAPDLTTNTYTIPAPTGSLAAADQVVRLKDAHRQMRITFESNTIGGDFRMGLPFLHIQPGDDTVTT
jgi:uncharacterized protein affecting Mg2+/Co2+ transport